MERQTYLTPYGECEIYFKDNLWICEGMGSIGCGRTKASSYDDFIRHAQEADDLPRETVDPTEYLC